MDGEQLFALLISAGELYSLNKAITSFLSVYKKKVFSCSKVSSFGHSSDLQELFACTKSIDLCTYCGGHFVVWAQSDKIQ